MLSSEKLSVGLLHRHIWHGLQKFWSIWLANSLSPWPLHQTTQLLNRTNQNIWKTFKLESVYWTHQRWVSHTCTRSTCQDSYSKYRLVNTANPVYGLSMIECRAVGVGPFNLGSSSGGQPCQHRSVPHVQQNLFEKSEAHFQDSNSIVNPCRLSNSTVCTIHIYRGRSTNTCRKSSTHTEQPSRCLLAQSQNKSK